MMTTPEVESPRGFPEGFRHEPDGLWCDGIRLSDVAAKFGTPCYVYSTRVIDRQLRRLAEAFSGINVQPCYAAKANSNPQILRRIAQASVTPGTTWGMDAVSGGELEAGIAAGFKPKQMIFSGVGKRESELELAISLGVTINIESLFELEDIIETTRKLGRSATIGLRFNPDIDPHTHPKITTGTKRNKFGLAISSLGELLERIRKQPGRVKLAGVSTHIGSQVRDLDAWKNAACQLADIATRVIDAEGMPLEFIDFGGGFPVRYAGDNEPPAIEQFAHVIGDIVTNHAGGKLGALRVMIEPGRWVVAESGALLARVIGVKNNFIVVDASMTELIRPALYEARHEVMFESHNRQANSSGVAYDIVGPVCESSDILAWDVKTAVVPEKNQLAIILQAGAYGYSMSSNYNLRPRPPEVIVNSSPRP